MVHSTNLQSITAIMVSPKSLDELTRKLMEALPKGLGQIQADVKKNLRTALEAALGRMDLVTREEFDVQTTVLARSREQLIALEEKLGELETELHVLKRTAVESSGDTTTKD